ncbi:MAG: ABC transporter ATP-binding protein [Bdellovibrio sp.]
MELRLKEISTPFLRVKNFHIPSGERLLIKGPSGTGKTTLLHILAGLYIPTSGEVLWDNEDLGNFSENHISRLRKSKVSLVFQNLNLLPYLTATENIELGGISATKAQELLNVVGLTEKGRTLTQKMSLGEQQRVAIARALGQTSQALLADEPTSSLDDTNATAIMDLLTRQNKNTLVMVSHDHRVEKYFDRILTMKEITA